MALRQQIARFAELVRDNKELISVAGDVGLGLVGLGATYILVRADKRVLEVKLQKESELRQKDVEKEREVRRKGEEGLKAMIEAAKAEAAKETMERILQLGFHEDYENRRELEREGQ
ncbi:hypothetical protein COCOBI_04-2650 [Coccomyxa sp. Obi]|nr:hypothetical protein COCOBI_04-2650 [Coccomyxa sp. Obi]